MGEERGGPATAGGWRRWEPLLGTVTWPVSLRMAAVAEIGPGQRVLDVGCGMGDPTLQVAVLVGPHGRVVGLDLSEAMLAAARERTARARGVRCGPRPLEPHLPRRRGGRARAAARGARAGGADRGGGLGAARLEPVVHDRHGRGRGAAAGGRARPGRPGAVSPLDRRRARPRAARGWLSGGAAGARAALAVRARRRGVLGDGGGARGPARARPRRPLARRAGAPGRGRGPPCRALSHGRRAAHPGTGPGRLGTGLSRRRAVLLALGCALALRLGVAARGEVISADGVQYLEAAHLLRAGAWQRALASFYPPGYPAVVAAVEPVVGGWERAGRAVSVIAGALGVVPLAGIAELAGLDDVAFAAALFGFALAPYPARYAADVRSEAFYGVLLLLAVWAAAVALLGGGRLAPVLAGLARGSASCCRSAWSSRPPGAAPPPGRSSQRRSWWLRPTCSTSTATRSDGSSRARRRTC